jgi:hypothetical protein
MGRQALLKLDLAGEPGLLGRPRARLRGRRGEHLEGDPALELLVLGLVDHAEGAATDLAREIVFAERGKQGSVDWMRT